MWRGARVVEWDGLENRCGGNSTQGSNPCPSAIRYKFLAEIKQDPDLKHIPVIMLSTSGSKHDIRKAYELHANCYLIKPVELEDFLRVIRSLEDFWFNMAMIP